jgi:hypothetical protein
LAHATKIKNSHTPKKLDRKKTVSTIAVVQSSEKLIKTSVESERLKELLSAARRSTYLQVFCPPCL